MSIPKVFSTQFGRRAAGYEETLSAPVTAKGLLNWWVFAVLKSQARCLRRST
ncbi:hypothetical protein ACN429_21925 [Pseudomonas oryzihabitans]|jgi:hypothetical protein|uniref:hypothetical protein n=1 Tax=Pseudomonas oryzihabitans TaxID=47885 RepID=UPI0012EC750E